MKQMAEAAASVLGLEAQTIEQPLDAPVDVLLFGTAVYAAGVDGKVKDFIAQLDPAKVGKVICFSSSAILESSYAQVKKLLEERGIAVDSREFHCRGQLTLLHRGHPDSADIENLKTFVKSLNL
jgi:hypothetical protein